MNKREYESILLKLQKEKEVIEKSRMLLTRTFKQECKHPAKNLKVITNDFQDEFGKWMDSWTTHTFLCTRCGTKLPETKRSSMLIKDLRVALNAVNAD